MRDPARRTSTRAEPSRQTRQQLHRLRRQLLNTNAEHQTQNEAAQAVHEELEAINEELRSAAEELEAGRDELQSMNEALTAVNQELKVKVEELRDRNNDFQNFINATDIGTIFLDRALRIKLWTPRARTVFDLIHTDIGRPLSDLTSRLRVKSVHSKVSDVLERLDVVEEEVETVDGQWYLMRVLPYRTLDHRVEGVVLTFQDVTDRRHARDKLRQSEEAKVVALQKSHRDLQGRMRITSAQLAEEVEAHADAEGRVIGLLGRVVNAQEDERRRLSRELHDGIGQQLTALRLAIERIGPGTDAATKQAIDIMTALNREVDTMAWQLRPPVLDELGLGAALPRFVYRWMANTGIHAECRVEGFTSGRLPSQADVAFYRIAQEALNNVAKHASAARVDVVLTTSDDEVTLVIEDDGDGFDVAHAMVTLPGSGLLNMRERAALVSATMDIESARGKGTAIFVRYHS